MMKEMGHLPPRLLEMPSVKTVNGWYGASLHELHSFKDSQASTETVKKYGEELLKIIFVIFDCFLFYRFTEALQNIRKRHSTVIETLAQVKCFQDLRAGWLILFSLGLYGVF